MAHPIVYILLCRDGSLYTGATKNLPRRLDQHRSGTASKYTRARRPVHLAWSRTVRTWRSALQLERRIKQLSRAEKLALVRGGPAARLPRSARGPAVGWRARARPRARRNAPGD